MLETEIKINIFLMEYCRMLVADIADETMTEQPLTGVNHPAWILGHLAFSADRARGLLGHAKELPPEWGWRLGPETKLTCVRSDYPSKDELMKTIERSFESLRRQASAATTEQLGQPSTNPYTKHALPTIQEAFAFLLSGHMGVHLGQLSMWRRMKGMAALF